MKIGKKRVANEKTSSATCLLWEKSKTKIAILAAVQVTTEFFIKEI